MKFSIAGKNAQKFPPKSLKKTLKIEIYVVETHLFGRIGLWPKSAKKHLSVFSAITLRGTERFFSDLNTDKIARKNAQQSLKKTLSPS